MAFAQLTYRTSLRDIETCLRTQATKLYHMGIQKEVSRVTLASTNQVRNWKVFVELAQNLFHIPRTLHADDTLSGLDIDDPDYVLNSTTINFCLSLFLCVQFRKTKGAIKSHTFLDLHDSFPTFLHIFVGKFYDINVTNYPPPEAGAFYIMNRAYPDFERFTACISANFSLFLRKKTALSPYVQFILSNQ